MPNDQLLLTLPEVAERLGVPVKTIYAWRHQGIAPRGIRVGKHVRVRPADLDRWIQEHEDDGGTAPGRPLAQRRQGRAA